MPAKASARASQAAPQTTTEANSTAPATDYLALLEVLKPENPYRHEFPETEIARLEALLHLAQRDIDRERAQVAALTAELATERRRNRSLVRRTLEDFLDDT